MEGMRFTIILLAPTRSAVDITLRIVLRIPGALLTTNSAIGRTILSFIPVVTRFHTFLILSSTPIRELNKQMNQHILKALDQRSTGDVFNYLAVNDYIIHENSGVHDNKSLSIDAYDPPCPVNKGIYTKVKITDESIDVVSIDKSALAVKVNLKLVAGSTLLNFLNTEYGAVTANKNIVSLKNKMTYIFFGLKASKHLFDAYRIYSNGRKTACEQAEALYEGSLDRMMKAQEELDEKPYVYTRWDRAKALDEAICGTYFTLEDIRTGRSLTAQPAVPGTVDIEFTAVVPLDDFLPFNAMTMFPSCAFGSLTMELKLAIQNNFVLCQCDPSESSHEYLMLSGSRASTVDPSGFVGQMATFMQGAEGQKYTHAFTQIGDPINLRVLKVSAGADPVSSGKITEARLSWETVVFEPNVTAGSIVELRSNLNGFNIKDTVKQQIIDKYSTSSYIVPAQFVDYQAFSQVPRYGSTRCNNTYTLTNCSAIGFLFPRTHNEITVSRNPNLSSVQAQVDNKPFPDKPFSTHSPEHSNYCLTNAGFDSLFSASREYGYSLRFNEMQTIEAYDGNPAHGMIGLEPTEDNTSYCFYVATQRPSGWGTFADGLTKESAQISLIMSAEGTANSHPNKYVDGALPPIMLILQDCFWRCTTSGCEFIINDPSFALLNGKK